MLIAAGALSCSAATVGSVTPQKHKGQQPRLAQALQARLAQKAQSPAAAIAKAASSRQGVYAAAASGQPDATMKSEGGWGMLTAEDGTDWYYTTKYTLSGSYYSGAQVTVYDNAHAQVGQFNVQVPAGTKVNQIQPFGTITSKFFDRDQKTKELLVAIHAVGDASNNYTGAYYTQVYQLDGTKLATYNGSGVQVNIKQNSWTSYDRLIIINDSTVDTGETDSLGYAVTLDYEFYDIYKGSSWTADTATVEHRFTIDLDKTYYSEGSPFNIWNIDGTPYYTVAQYAKNFETGLYDATTWEPVFTKNNRYNVAVYNKNYQPIDSISVPLVTPSDAYVRMAAFGQMSTKDLTKGYFSQSAPFDYVITYVDYVTAADDYRYDFQVFNSTDTTSLSICDNVYNTWGTLADISGQSDQMYFMREVDDVQTVMTVDLPSCQTHTIFPTTIDGQTISTDLNRYPTTDGYQYVMKISQGYTDADGNVIARVGWYNDTPSATLNRYATFNLGPSAENFRLNLQSAALNPYLFNTDDELEYFYIAKVKRADSDALDDILYIANEKNGVLKTFDRSDEKGDLYSGTILVDDPQNPELMVVYCDSLDNYNFEFYKLPFNKFEAGGTGTAADPYLISTIGDLQQVKSNLTASYKFANDIDAESYPTHWTPIQDFAGTLDGDDHHLDNLYISSDDSEVGLFGAMANGAKVKNLTLINPSLELNSTTQYAGVIAGSCMGDSIENVHVHDAIISGDAAAVVGGLVGTASLYTRVLTSSFNGSIEAANATPVGGIAGQTRTSSDLKAVAASGDYTAASTLGGIVGSTSTSCNVYNAHNMANLTAGNTVGGIVGSNDERGTITNSIAEGMYKANKLQYSWQKYSIGGIVGYLQPDWQNNSAAVVSGCYSAASIYTANAANDTTAHRIVGYSIANEQDTKATEKGVKNCYADAQALVNEVTVDGSDAMDGITTQTADTEFFQTLGYVFGDNINGPWLATSQLPVLYFEDAVHAVVIDEQRVDLLVGDSKDITVTVYGTSASDMTFYSDDVDVATATLTSGTYNQNVIQITGKADGETTVYITVGNVTAACKVYVGTASAISEPTATTNGSLTIVPQQGQIKAEGASTIVLYSINGQNVASTKGNAISTEGLSKGLYVAVATAADGQRTAAKVIIK